MSPASDPSPFRGIGEQPLIRVIVRAGSLADESADGTRLVGIRTPEEGMTEVRKGGILQRFAIRGESGQTMSEYAVVLTVVAMGVAGTIGILRGAILAGINQVIGQL